jgi:transcriptional regulator with XRE-family HTH domain
MMKTIGLSTTLKKLMEEQKVSSATLSKATLIPKSTISSYLSGKKAAYSPDHLLSLSSYFSVSVDFLLTGIESDYALLNTLKTEGLFEGWLKVKIERAIPSKVSSKRKES